MIKDTAILKTERLTLRPLHPGDAEAIAAGVGNYDVSRWLAVVPFPYGVAEARSFLADRATEARRVWGICDADGLQGVVGIVGELGYWLARPAWGRGYGREAVTAVLHAAFADASRREIRSSHMVGNDRSRRVLDAAGFRDIGEEMRHFRALGQSAPSRIMRLTRAEWRGLSGRGRRATAAGEGAPI